MPYKTFLPNHYNDHERLKIAGTANNKQLSKEFSICVWNIYKAKKNSWRGDFLKTIKSCDIILLQESVLNSQHDYIFEHFSKWQWVMARSYQNAYSLVDTGVKTGCLVAASSETIIASQACEPILKTRKMVLATTYPIEDYDLHLLIINIHAINFVSLYHYHQQLNQIRIIVEMHKGPIIVAGDLNTWSRSRYKSFMLMAQECSLVEAKLLRKSRWQHLYKHLDYIFYRDLEVLHTHVHSDIKSSDHYPITARFSLSAILREHLP